MSSRPSYTIPKPSQFTLWVVTVVLVAGMAMAMLYDRARDSRARDEERRETCTQTLAARDEFEDIDATIWGYVADVADADPKVTRELLAFIHNRYDALESPPECE